MYPTYLAIGTQFPICDWSEFYGEVEEHIPPSAPEAIGKVVYLHIFVDSDQTGDNIHEGLTVDSSYIIILP